MIARSLDFLVAQQNPLDGRLPNYGSNDGSMPRVLSTCDFSDMRPTLQAVSVLTRGERLYPEGPWDEECAWIVGADALSRAPLRPTKLRSMSFAATGFHALRGEDPSTFSVLRCGTVRDRFGQIDMLHLDVWWRGLNVLVDGGTWLYNGRREWLEHFLRTASHNTVTVDGRDQMLHWRQFKFLYWTRAKLLAFEDRPTRATVTGEHSGYARLAGRCVHRRAVLFAKDDLVVVIDRISGEGRHSARLHWLTADHPFVYDAATATLTLSTPRGEFSLATFDERGSPAAGDVVRGGESPPRGDAQEAAEFFLVRGLDPFSDHGQVGPAVVQQTGETEPGHRVVDFRQRGDALLVPFRIGHQEALRLVPSSRLPEQSSG